MYRRDRILIQSPFAGGVTVDENASINNAATQAQEQIRFATLNPGRTGFSCLGTNHVLHWRLFAVASVLEDLDIDVCVLPGARLPPRVSLPENFPYVFLGAKSVSWSTVGVFVKRDWEQSCIILEEFGLDNVLWLLVDGTPKQFLLCAFYPKPGGDEHTWGRIVDEVKLLSVKYPDAVLILLGDANIHLSTVVQHQAPCRCMHCKQSPADSRIEAMITGAGLAVNNPCIPTHTSGTTIDLILSRVGALPDAEVHPNFIAGSDHKLVFLTVPSRFQVTSNYELLGRVAWSTGGWEDALQSVSEALSQLHLAIEPLISSPQLLPDTLGGGHSKKYRRAVLDAAAWSRNFIYLTAGHFSGIVRARSYKPKRSRTLELPCYTDNVTADFKAIVADRVWHGQRAAVNKYLELRRTSQSSAEHYLSKCFKSRDKFEIALVDEQNGQPLDTTEMISQLVHDLQARANNDFPQDPAVAAALQRYLHIIRASGAAHHTYPHTRTISYSQQEVDDVCDAFSQNKQCLGFPYAALKAQQGEGRKVTWALVTLGQHMGLTSSHWSLRRFGPIRKAGPRTVRHSKNLRPISVACDLAQVQDALWIARNGPLLETFCGPAQVGGVSDPISLVLALVIHAQLRSAQGMPTYFAFTDLKWAFDVASIPGMLFNCFAAGVSTLDWLVIDDVLSMDSQCLQLHGWLSAIFTLGNGLAQGRRFSVHLFNGLLRWLPDEIEYALLGGCRTILPKHSRRALLEAHALRPAVSTTDMPSRYRNMPQEYYYLLAQPYNYHLLVQLLSTMDSLADRISLIDQLGTEPLPPLQYVDDLGVACPSAGAVRAILSREPESACSVYTRKARAAFNYGPGKNAAMALMDSPPLDEESIGCSTVEQHQLLGVTIDDQLTFQPFLYTLVNKVRAAFLELFHAGETGGFAIPVIAAQVTFTISPLVFHMLSCAPCPSCPLRPCVPSALCLSC